MKYEEDFENKLTDEIKKQAKEIEEQLTDKG